MEESTGFCRHCEEQIQLSVWLQWIASLGSQ
jgi:hypothetical protein